jgi:hypothetical protein
MMRNTQEVYTGNIEEKLIDHLSRLPVFEKIQSYAKRINRQITKGNCADITMTLPEQSANLACSSPSVVYPGASEALSTP